MNEFLEGQYEILIDLDRYYREKGEKVDPSDMMRVLTKYRNRIKTQLQEEGKDYYDYTNDPGFDWSIKMRF